MLFGKRLKSLREEKSLKQDDIAKVMNVDRSTVGKWESSPSRPDYDKLIKLADFFGVSTDYLLGNDDVYDIGCAIKGEREHQGYSLKELSTKIRITEEELNNYEKDLAPISEYLLKKICEIFDISVYRLLYEYELYDEYIPSQFNGDVDAYEAFKKAQDKDALNEGQLANKSKPNTIAAHLPEGVELTEEEKEQLNDYIQFILSKRKK